MKTKGLFSLVVGIALAVLTTSTVWALASEDILLTVTIQVLSVDVEDNCVGAGNAWALGTVVAGTTCESWQAAPVAYTAAPAAWQDGVDVENDGNGNETMGLVVAYAGAGAWTNDTDGDDDNAAGADEYVYRAIFDDPASGHTFETNDRVDTAMQKAEDSGAGTIFTDGDADGEDVAALGSALLFVQFDMPTSTAEAPPTQQEIDLTISAETTY